MTDAYVEKTQKELGAIITTPKLTEKLLSKPPFRFLHDIVTSFLKATTFPEGLYTSDMLDSGNITDKGKKIEFLTLLIAAIEAATGQKVSASPSKIIAGQEADKTNELLQLLATCAALPAEKKVAAVAKAKGGKPEAPKQEAQMTAPNKEKDDEKKKEEERRLRKEEQKHEDEAEKKREAEEKKKRKKEAEVAAAAAAAAAAAEEAKQQQQKKEEEKAAALARDGDDKKKHGDDGAASKKLDDAKKKESEERKKKRKDTSDEKTPKVDDEEHRKRHEEKKRREREAAEKEEVATAENSASLLARPSRPEPRATPTTTTTTTTAAAAAGKAPPRTKPTHEVVDGSPSGAAPVAGVIRESKRTNDKTSPLAGSAADNEDWMRIAEQQEAKPASSTAAAAPGTASEAEAKGYLGQQALKAKREQEEAAAQRAREVDARAPRDGGIVIHTNRGGKSSNATVEGELSKLREQLQLLTKASNPLGKLLEVIYDDIDTMARELEMWRAEARGQALAAADARRQTMESLQEVHAQLQNLEDAINDQILKTHNIRRNVINNENAIAGMVRMIVSPDIAKR